MCPSSAPTREPWSPGDCSYSLEVSYLLRRLLFTLTGFRLLPGPCPGYSSLLRLLLWLLPLLVTLLPSLLPPPFGPCLSGVLLLALPLTLQIFTRCLCKGRGAGGEGEEEELGWDGPLGAATWAVLLPPRPWLTGFIFQVSVFVPDLITLLNLIQ